MSPLLQKPSQLLSQVKVDKCADWTVLKFDRTLQKRQAELFEKHEQGTLSGEESAELAAIQELAAIFSYINSQMAHQRRNCLR